MASARPESVPHTLISATERFFATKEAIMETQLHPARKAGMTTLTFIEANAIFCWAASPSVLREWMDPFRWASPCMKMARCRPAQMQGSETDPSEVQQRGRAARTNFATLRVKEHCCRQTDRGSVRFGASAFGVQLILRRRPAKPHPMLSSSVETALWTIDAHRNIDAGARAGAKRVWFSSGVVGVL